jgi:hypothetical protein
MKNVIPVLPLPLYQLPPASGIHILNINYTFEFTGEMWLILEL